MIPNTALVLLDTNVLVQLIRKSALGERIESEYQLSSRQERPLISVVTVGEMRALALKFGWGLKKVADLTALLHELVIVDINSDAVIANYAEIDRLSEQGGRPMGKNDIWIAATAAATNAWLLTTDKDFDHLHGTRINREWVDPAVA